MRPRTRAVDIVASNLGSMITLDAGSRRGRAWLFRHVNTDIETGAIYCDHRYGIDILQAAQSAGLRLRDAATGRTA